MSLLELTELQKTQAAYSHFTFEEWQILAQCVGHVWGAQANAARQLDDEVFTRLLSKFPSATL